MPYKPTGRPQGRPRKTLPEAHRQSAPQKPVEAKPAYNAKDSRLRQSYRAQADRLNPNPAVTIYDSRGRAREPSDHHKWIGKPWQP